MTDWNLWMRQALSIIRLEWKRSFLPRRAWWIYLLAFGPVVIGAGHSLVVMRGGQQNCSLPADYMVYAGIFQLFYLRLAIFFGCAAIFSNLFRGEVLERTLHYYLLAPVRRDLLAIGKYLAGLTTSVFFFGLAVALSFLAIGMHFGPASREFLFQGPGLAQLGWYLLVTALACVGYGAVFLLAGLLFRNPMLPAAVVLVWESINPFLPPLLKKCSVIFYLKSLCPVDVPFEGGFALLTVSADPAPASLAIPGLLAVSGALLYIAARKARRLEISYSE